MWHHGFITQEQSNVERSKCNVQVVHNKCNSRSQSKVKSLKVNVISYQNTKCAITDKRWSLRRCEPAKPGSLDKSTSAVSVNRKSVNIVISPYSLWLLSRLVPPSSASEDSDLMALYKLVFNFNFNLTDQYYAEKSY